MFDRKKIGEVAKDIADHLQIVENIKALQVGQKEIADAIAKLGDRLRTVEVDLRVLKAEVKFEALKETQGAINAVQGNINERIEAIAVKVGIMQHELPYVRTLDVDAVESLKMRKPISPPNDVADS